MSFRKWEDFLEAKKMEAQPPTKAKELKCDGDTSKQIVQGNMDKPPQGKGASPYHGPHAKNSPKKGQRVAEKNDKKPLGNEASPPFSNPKEVMPLGEKPEGKQTVENFLNETHKLSNLDFAKQMVSKKKDSIVAEASDNKEFDPTLTCQFSGRKVVPAFYEVAKYMAHMLPQNESARRTFLRELKSVDGGLNSLINEVFGHKEAYGEIVNAMGTPESVIPRRLARAMNESYTNWMTEMGMELPTPSMGEAPMDPMGGLKTNSGEAGALGIGGSGMGEISLDPMGAIKNTLNNPLNTANTKSTTGVNNNTMTGMLGGGNNQGTLSQIFAALGPNTTNTKSTTGVNNQGMAGMLGRRFEAVDLPIDRRMSVDDDEPEDFSDDSALSSGPPVPSDQPTDVVPPIRGGMPSLGMGGMGGGGGMGPMAGSAGGPPGGSPGMPPDMSNDPGSDTGMGDMQSPDNVPPAMGAEEPAGTVDTPAPKQNSPKKEFAYHHLAREMVKYDNIKNVMREIMGG